MSNFSLLRNKEIISILDGDLEIEESIGNIRIAMPYLSGPMLCELSQKFGLIQIYKWEKGAVNLSRWQYLDKLLDYTIKNNKINQLLAYMMSKDSFSNQLNTLDSVSEIEETYNYIVKKVIDKINSILYFCGHQLIVIGNQYLIKEINSNVKIDMPNLKIIDREYILDLSKRANKDIDEENYDSAITKARTILEEAFCYVIEKKEQYPSDNGDINRLYKQVKDLYNMHTDKNMDKRINKLLSGLENIVQALAEMRNNNYYIRRYTISKKDEYYIFNAISKYCQLYTAKIGQKILSQIFSDIVKYPQIL